MKYIVTLTLCLFICVKYAHGETSCAVGWEQYIDEKCFKIIPGTLQTYDNALDLCGKQGEGVTLLTIHSQQEQDFLSDILFRTHKIVDEVWIGAKVSNKKVTWVDGSKDDYTNWETGKPSNVSDNCVQMQPEVPNTGKWVDEPCSKKNQVVCQNGQLWSREHMQQMIVEMRDYQKNIMPIGFIYIQLPTQPEPKVLWPKMNWDNITPHYDGLFFRAEGGNSSKFDGSPQEQDSPRLVMTDVHGPTTTNRTSDIVKITPGVNSNDLYTGDNNGIKNPVFINFLVSAAEVRPRNQAIRIWKRIQ